jgi:hypothetical protein
MTAPFHYSSHYTLDKSHFSETFDESIIVTKKAYLKSIALIILGFAILYFTDFSPYAAWFIVVVGCVDALNIYFKKPWWLARQMISEAANVELTLTIDERGVTSQSSSVESTILWQDIIKIEKTKQGWLLHHKGGKNYLSGRCLSAPANEFIQAKAQSNNTER